MVSIIIIFAAVCIDLSHQHVRGVDGSDATQREPATREQCVYKVTVDDKYRRPVIRFKPPKDDDGNRPLDIAQAFLLHIGKGDLEKASEMVLFEPNSHGPTKAISIGKEGFNRACDRFREFENNCEIVLSGTTVNDKGDYWTIRYHTTATNGKEYHHAFVFVRRSGKWVIVENSTWTEWAGEDYDLQEAIANDKYVPMW